MGHVDDSDFPGVRVFFYEFDGLSDLEFVHRRVRKWVVFGVGFTIPSPGGFPVSAGPEAPGISGVFPAGGTERGVAKV